MDTGDHVADAEYPNVYADIGYFGSLLTQIKGVSGRAILQALIEGERDPDRLLALVRRGVKAPPGKLRAALTGRVSERHRFLLRQHARWRPPSPRSTGRWTVTSPPSVRRSACCGPSRASAT